MSADHARIAIAPAVAPDSSTHNDASARPRGHTLVSAKPQPMSRASAPRQALSHPTSIICKSLPPPDCRAPSPQLHLVATARQPRAWSPHPPCLSKLSWLFSKLRCLFAGNPADKGRDEASFQNVQPCSDPFKHFFLPAVKGVSKHRRSTCMHAARDSGSEQLATTNDQQA